MRDQDQILDVLCIGFGPTSLSLAAGFHENQNAMDRVLFLEKNTKFYWQGENFPLGKCSMKSNFMHDLVTARNPSSKFSFVHYLWSTNLLVIFTNLSAIRPPRSLFKNYLTWCANQFERLGWVKYGVEAQLISPISGGNSTITSWRVTTKDRSGKMRDDIARKVIVATGSHAYLPDWAAHHSFGGKLQHSSGFGKAFHSLQKREKTGLNIGIVGSDDEAIEISNHCQSLPGTRSTCFLNERRNNL
jgi:L-ornithine N5-oxygenase